MTINSDYDNMLKLPLALEKQLSPKEELRVLFVMIRFLTVNP
jgi:hypothetical protein